jgi:HK97 gp10 family phage protein
LEAATGEAASRLYHVVYRYASLKDHSLADLAKMGHPYARKDSKKSTDSVSIIKYKDSGPHPDYMVHAQSGNLAGNIKKKSGLMGNKAIAAVGVYEADVPYIKYLIFGTSKMRPRPFLQQAWIDVQADVRKIIMYALSTRVGSRGTIRK